MLPPYERPTPNRLFLSDTDRSSALSQTLAYERARRQSRPPLHRGVSKTVSAKANLMNLSPDDYARPLDGGSNSRSDSVAFKNGRPPVLDLLFGDGIEFDLPRADVARAHHGPLVVHCAGSRKGVSPGLPRAALKIYLEGA